MKTSSILMGSVRTFVSAVVIAAIGSCFNASSVQAQVLTNGITSGNAIVTVALVDVMALVVTNPVVAITYATMEDYSTGKTVPVTAHLLVSSNRAYDVKVQAGGDLTPVAGGSTLVAGVTLGVVGASASIPISRVQVRATTSNIGSTPQIPLSTALQTLIDNAPGVMAKPIDVTYSTAANDPLFVGSGAYTSTLTYSITAN